MALGKDYNRFVGYGISLMAGGLLLLFLSKELVAQQNTPRQEMPVIKSMDINKRDPILLKWRRMVNKNLRLLRQGPNTRLHSLQFARYRVKKGEELWQIISATVLNVDTLAQINQLSSIHDIKEGDWLLIPNMRGVFRRVSPQTKVQGFLRKWGVSRSHLYSANDYAYIINNKRHLFVPGGEFTSLERSLFFGTAFLVPLKNYRVTSDFGSRFDPFTRKRTFHGGIDMAAPRGTKVYAARKGRVVYAGRGGGYGLLVVLRHALGYKTYYGHLSKIKVGKGQKVRTNQVLGLVGSTGRSTGPHLHFEIRRKGRNKNPQSMIRGLEHN